MMEGLLQGLTKGGGGSIIFIFLILLLLCGGFDGGLGGIFDGIFDNGILLIFLVLFLFGAF